MRDSNDSGKHRFPWRWLRRISFAVLVCLFVTGLFELYTHYQLTTKLAQAEAQLDETDPGWRLRDITAARAVIPDEENGALVSTMAAKLLPDPWKLQPVNDAEDNSRPGWPPGELQEALNELEPVFQLDDDLYLKLRKERNERLPALVHARRLADLPKGRHPINYERNILNTRMDSQDKARMTTTLLKYDAFICAQEKDAGGAIRACCGAINAGRSIGDEPSTIAQLIRISCVSSGCQSLERVLAQSEASSDELMALQRLLEDEDRQPIARIAIRGERAMFHELFTTIENDGDPDESAPTARKNWSLKERFLTWKVGDYFRDEHPRMLSLMSESLSVAELLPEKQALAFSMVREKVANLPKSVKFTPILLPAVEKVLVKCRQQHAHLRCMIVTLAVERYRQKHGIWPESLEQLTPEMLNAVHLDPYDGKPIHYKRLDDGVIVYSVGPDGVDDDGTLDRENPTRPGTDLGFRLWDVKKRRQPAPPPPPREKPDDPN